MLIPYFNAKKIFDGVYHISESIIGPAMVCSTLIVGKEKALLIDTGSGIGDLKQKVESITSLPLIVVNTHGHANHVSGNYQFDEIYIHEDDIPVKDNSSNPDVKNYILDYFRDIKVKFPKNFSKEEYTNRIDNSILLPIEDGHVFDLGDRTLYAIHIPGHTKGSIALLDKDDKILFSGDSISPQVHMLLDESTSINDYIHNLNKISNLDFNSIVSSHFTEVYKKNLVNKLINCAKNIDISKSNTFSSPMIPIEGLIYEEGSVAIVYTEDKL